VRQVIARVPAKINLVLAVGAVRPDGYHELATVFQAVSLYDEVVASPGDGVSVSASGPYGYAVPAGDLNIAVRAARTLAHHAGIAADVRLDITKAIPVAGGLAGGSADAAGALLACNELWRLGLDDRDLSGIAAALGSDVPFMLAGGTAVGTGRGEQLRHLDTAGMLHWVLAIADGQLSTSAVYRRLDSVRTSQSVSKPDVGQSILTALQTADPVAVGLALRNDLQEVAVELRPTLTQTLQTGRDLGAVSGIVSGSGPTCAFLARSADHARSLAAELVSAGVCADAIAVAGPAFLSE
jgi:4-diphosphocytidyl-2-C-methyl-D-erythritol kinase